MKAALGLIFCLGWLGTASAQSAADHWTIEALTAQARVVFRGYVKEVSKLDLEPKPGKPAMSRITLNVHVEQRLKGSSDSWMTIDRVAPTADMRYDLWAKSHSETLFFIFSEDAPRAFPGSAEGPGLPLPPGQSWSAIHLGPVDPAEVAMDPHSDKGTFSMDLSVLTDGKAKIDAVQKYQKNNPDPAKVVRLAVPASLTSTIGYASGPQYIVVPITPDLEPVATKMVSTPEAFLPTSHTAADVAALKAAGTKALATIQSAKS